LLLVQGALPAPVSRADGVSLVDQEGGTRKPRRPGLTQAFVPPIVFERELLTNACRKVPKHAVSCKAAASVA
jgi:hypothetical protein